jgi:protease-4
MAKKKVKAQNKWKTVLIILAIFFVLSWILSSMVAVFFGAKSIKGGNVALIKINGVITAEGISSFVSKGTSSTEIIELIKEADEDPSIQAILFEINSPGGSAVASKEIADTITRTEKPTYALIREVGASGGYWIASATDHIMANEMSITGSIGVIASYIEFEGLLRRYNMSYQRLVAGKYKDMGSPFKSLPMDEREILQDLLNKIHNYFIGSVAENRNMDIEKVKEIATGEIYLGSEALELGLIDSLGDKEAVTELIKKDLNITEVEFAEFRKEKSLIDLFAGAFSENFHQIGQGIGSAITEQKTTNRLEIFT